MKKMMLVNRMIGEKAITIGVSFLYTANKTEEKALLFDVSTLIGVVGKHLNFTSNVGVFFEFTKEDLSDKYFNNDRVRYNNLLCELQRYGESRGCDVRIKTI